MNTDLKHRDGNRKAHDQLLADFLASSFFAEDEATPVVEKLLRHPADGEEQALLRSYAREEDGHARVLDAELARRGLPKGQPFWIQKAFRRMSARTTLLIQFYHVEILAGCFYGAVAARVRDGAARELLRRLLRDEARHIRLHRELLARQIAAPRRAGAPQGARLRLPVSLGVLRDRLVPGAAARADPGRGGIGAARGRSSTSSAPTCRSCSARATASRSRSTGGGRRRRRRAGRRRPNPTRAAAA